MLSLQFEEEPPYDMLIKVLKRHLEKSKGKKTKKKKKEKRE